MVKIRNSQNPVIGSIKAEIQILKIEYADFFLSGPCGFPKWGKKLSKPTRNLFFRKIGINPIFLGVPLSTPNSHKVSSDKKPPKWPFNSVCDVYCEKLSGGQKMSFFGKKMEIIHIRFEK